MAKPQRSPVLGYNHNVRYHGRVYHVQTEDSGPGNPRLYTHLFFAGTILASKKQEYDAKEPEDAVKAMMQRLHKEMIKELSHGAHDPRISAFFMSRGESPVLEDAPAAVPVVEAPAPEPAGLSIRADDIRMVAVSGSIEAAVPRPTPSTAPSPVTVAPASGPVSITPPAPVAPAPAVRPQATPRPVVMVNPGEVKRSPVVLASSADGVVVQRNVVINVGGGGGGGPPPVNAPRMRGPRPRPAVPYVVREGSYANAPIPTRSASDAQTQPLASGRDVRLPWESTPTRGSEPTSRGRAAVSAPPERTPRPAAPERTPSERAFAADLVSDKSLDEVILEYLSDDAESSDPER